MSAATQRLLAVWVLIAFVTLLYWPTAISYSEAWTDFDNRGNTHGYLIAFMCASLLFLRRDELTGPILRKPQVAYIALAILSLAWLLAYRASIQTAHQLLLPLIFLSAIYAVFGARIARSCLFPVGFLYFALPFWGVINGLLQSLTIAATRVILEIFGLPVRIQGDLVRIPEGTFVIEGGCSGLHFFVVALAIAAYYGALHRDSARQRVRLLAIAAVLALLTNWIRVSTVIAAGHFTNMQSYLVRVSHYGFGWALFAVAMAVFFLLASRIPAHAHDAPNPLTEASARNSAWPSALTVLLTFAAAALGPALAWEAARADSTAAVRPPLEAPARGWSGPLHAVTSWRPIFIGADSERLSSYRREVAVVEVYTAEYAFQRQGKKLLGFTNSILGADAYIVLDQSVVGRNSHRFVSLEAQDAQGVRALLWYVYEIGNREMTSGLRAQLWYGVRSLAAPVDARIVALRAECTADCRVAREALQEFVDSICDDASRFGDCRQGP